MTLKELRAFVDRIEGDKAVLLVGENQEDTVVVPARYLPDEAVAGSVITIGIRYEPGLTADAKDEVEKLIRGLRKQE